jgi:hypothetical protein
MRSITETVSIMALPRSVTVGPFSQGCQITRVLSASSALPVDADWRERNGRERGRASHSRYAVHLQRHCLEAVFHLVTYRDGHWLLRGSRPVDLSQGHPVGIDLIPVPLTQRSRRIVKVREISRAYENVAGAILVRHHFYADHISVELVAQAQSSCLASVT